MSLIDSHLVVAHVASEDICMKFFSSVLCCVAGRLFKSSLLSGLHHQATFHRERQPVADPALQSVCQQLLQDFMNWDAPKYLHQYLNAFILVGTAMPEPLTITNKCLTPTPI